MGDLIASDVETGDPITADQIERLFLDIWKNHQHTTSGDGGAIAHSDLVDDEGEHAKLDTHIEISDAFADNPGGAMGVHGLASDEAVLGITGNQMVIRYGTGNTGGKRTVEGSYIENRDKADFGFPRFVQPPVLCFACPTDGYTAHVSVFKVTENSMTMKFYTPHANSERSVPYCWIAIGRI